MIKLKKIILILTIVILIFCLCGCKTEKELLTIEGNTIQENPNYILKTEKEVYSSDIEVINYSLLYTGEGEGGCSFSYVELHKFDNGEWKMVPYREDGVVFIDLALILEPGKTVERKVDLKEYYDLPLSKGKYQLKVDFVISNTFFVE